MKRLCLLIFIWLGAFRFGIKAQILTSGYTTSGTNYTGVEKNNILYVGGSFQDVGRACFGQARVDMSGGKVDIANILHPDYTINVVIEDEKGGYFVGGYFQYLKDSFAPNLAHILPSGAIDNTFKFQLGYKYLPGISGLYKMGDTLFVSGYFDTVNGNLRDKLFAINLKNNALLNWAPNINGGYVYSITSNANSVFIGGQINTYNGMVVSNFIQLNRNDLSYRYSVGYNATVASMILDSSRVVARGSFGTSGWYNPGLILIDTNNLERALFGYQLSGYINKIEADPKGGWFLAGSFTLPDYPEIVNLMRLKSNYSLDTSFKFKLTSTVLDIAVVDSFIYCASSYGTINGRSYNVMAIINHFNKNIIDNKFITQANVINLYAYKKELIIKSYNELFRVSVPDMKKLPTPIGNLDVSIDSNYMYLTSGQGYISLGSGNVAEFNNNGKPSAIRAKQYLSSCVAAISDDNGGWFIVGNGLRHILADGSLDENIAYDFQAGTAESLLKYGDTLFVGGTFHNIRKYNNSNYTTISNLAVIDIKTGNIGSFRCNINKQTPNYYNDGNVKQMAIVGDSLVLSGYIKSVGTSAPFKSYNNTIKLDLKTWQYGDIAPVFDGTIYSMYQSDSFLYYAGFFKNVNGKKRRAICRFNKISNQLDAWNPLVLDSFASIHHMASDKDYIYVASRTYNPITYKSFHYVNRISVKTGSVVPFGGDLDSIFISNANFSVNKIQVQDDTLFIGGNFEKALSGKKHKNLIKVNKNNGQNYPLITRFNGSVIYIVPVAGGNYILGGNINDLDSQNNVLLSRYDLSKNFLDTWKISTPSTFWVPNKMKFAINRNSIYFANSNLNNATIDGITRSVIFKANKSTGKVTTFNANISPFTSYGVYGLHCVGNQVYMYHEYAGNIILKMIDGQDGIIQKITISGGQNLALVSGFNKIPFMTGTYQWYNSSSNARSFNSVRNSFEKGMNYFPGTFTSGSTGSSVFYNFNDSIYYLFEGSLNYVNSMADNGRFYSINTRTRQVKKLNLFSHYRIAGMCRKDTNILIYGGFDYLYDLTGVKINKPYVIKYDERLNKIDGKFNAQPNAAITNAFIEGNYAQLMGNATIMNRLPRKNICAIDLKADTVLSYSPDPNYTVWKMLVYDTALLISGEFYSMKYGSANRLALLDTRVGKIIYNFNASAIFTSMHIANNKLYAGGNFSNYAGSGINNLVRFNMASKALEPWNPKLNAKVREIVTDDSFVYVVGDFGQVNTKTQLYYAKLRKDNASNILLNFALKAPFGGSWNNGYASGLFVTDKLVYISGSFEYDNSRKVLLAINNTTNTPTVYKMDCPDWSSISYPIIAPLDDKLIMGKYFQTNPITINSINSGDLIKMDRFQSITYPGIVGSLYGSGTTFSFEKSVKYLHFMGNRYTLNHSQYGNILSMVLDSNQIVESVSEFTPKKSGNIGTTSVQVRGRLFDKQSEVFIENGNDTIWSSEVQFVDQNLIIPRFDFQNDSAGKYNLNVIFSSGKTAKADGDFELVKTGEVNIATSILGYEQIRPDRWFDYNIKVENLSNTDQTNIPVYFSIQTKGKAEVESKNIYADTFLYTGMDSIYGLKRTNTVYSLMLPRLGASDAYLIPVRIKMKSGDSFYLHAWNQLPVDNSRREKCIRQIWTKFSGINTSEICFHKELNKVDSAYEVNKDYEFGLAPGIVDWSKFYKNTLASCGGTYNAANLKKINQFNASPYFTTGIDSVCIYRQGRNMDSAVITDKKPFRLTVHLVNSMDPNDKIGPVSATGSTLMNELPSTFQYTIRFENDSSATAPAQNVTIRDTIDKNYFDIQTVHFNSIKVGDFKYFFAPNTNSIDKNFDLRDKSNVVLNLKTQMDTATGVVEWRFTSLDIQTLREDKLNPVYGFLPPNNATNRGQGSVSFEIDLKPGLGDVALIKNRADIIFDQNKNILTPYWTVEKDKRAPESFVLNLPETTANTSFNVSWKATDNLAVSKINVYVSSDKKNYKLWKTSRADSSAIFAGQEDSTYYFYSSAIDKVGNVESIPDSFDTKTTILVVKDLQPPVSRVLPLAAIVNTQNFTVSWQATDNVEVKNIAVYVSKNKLNYSLWKMSAGDSSAIYAGQVDSTYYFYSIATDSAGNLELAPDSFDAKTTIKVLSVDRIIGADYKLYPNPGDGNLHFIGTIGIGYDVVVYAINGAKINEWHCTSEAMDFAIPDKGLYVVKIFQNGMLYGTEKIVVY
ncbi:MAG: hypothetical protein KG003_07505 [Bacteroidetes bacterium]|nr:hypothetical protein [Bacteroidota bacterium]